MGNNILKDQWQEILDKSRMNYIQTIKSLSEHQSEVEKLISTVIKEYNSIQQEQLDNAMEWITASFKKREEYIKQFQSKLYESLGIMPSIEDLVYKKHFDEISELLADFYKKIFL
jgi:seryl-tRNA synthetase